METEEKMEPGRSVLGRARLWNRPSGIVKRVGMRVIGNQEGQDVSRYPEW